MTKRYVEDKTLSTFGYRPDPNEGGIVCMENRDLGYTAIRWTGPTWKPIRITEKLVGEIDFKSLPWPLWYVTADAMQRTYIFARADGWRAFTWLYWILKRDAKRLKRAIFIQFWKRGLLHTREGDFPQWRDIDGPWSVRRHRDV